MTNEYKTITYILLVAVIAGTGYYFHEDWKSFLFPVHLCAKPIEYSLGNLDNKFDISKTEFLSVIAEAEKVWEDAEGKELFTYSPEGALKVHFVYDYRQQTTDRLTSVGGAISEDKASYNRIKEEYVRLNKEYSNKEASYEKRSATYDKDLDAYDASVEYWNSKGGAPKKEYDELQEEQARLNAEATIINAKASELNTLSKTVNATARSLNELAEKLNLKVETFNTIGATTGEEFSEGEYIQDSEGKRINIYEFQSRAELLRLLEHELGHALGLGHVGDPDAIMYRMNSSSNRELTEDDRRELANVCHQ